MSLVRHCLSPHPTIYSSLIGVGVLMLLPRDNARAARGIALLTAVIGFVIALAGILGAKPGNVQTIADVSWVPALGIKYHLAADGISLTLVLLTGIAAVVEWIAVSGSCRRGLSCR